jgi:hypothetical protein
MKNTLLKMACVLALGMWRAEVRGVPFRIIAESDPKQTTHELASGDLTIGITEHGGGIINEVKIPGVGDIMDAATDMYGRAGQVAIRDGSHGGRYNPTQSGFHETLGTACGITAGPGRLVVEPRAVALWQGDGKYDFTRWENIGAEPYREPAKHGGAEGESDEDGLDEEDLSVEIDGNVYTKQEAEVFSEWDYYGTYEDCQGRDGIATAAIRHYFELRFIRPPGHALRQFRKGSPLWNGKAVRGDISHEEPRGEHPGTDQDMNGMIAVWSLRHDRKKWTPKFVHYRKRDKTWAVAPADGGVGEDNDGTVFLNADSGDPATGRALGLLRPASEINRFPVIGRDGKSGEIVYKDDRLMAPADGFRILHEMFRIPTMSKYGFAGTISGMLNRTRLEPDVYEVFRSEYYIFYGTPREIMEAVQAVERTVR